MKFFIVFMLLLSVLISSCSSTYYMLNYSEIKDEAVEENALIKLVSGEEIEGEIIEIGVDPNLNGKPISSSILTIPTAQVKEITTKNYPLGAFEGCALGVLGGALVGLGAFAALEYKDQLSISLVPIGGVLGFPIGLPVGIISGHIYNYVFSLSLPNEYVKIEIAQGSGRFSHFLRPKSFIHTDLNKFDQFITIPWEDKNIHILPSEFGYLSDQKNTINAIELAINIKFLEAKEEFEKILKNDSLDVLSRTGLTIAESVINRSIKTLPAVILFKGIDLQSKLEFDESLEKFNQVIKMNPEYDLFYFYRGNAYLNMDLPDSAIHDFNKVIELNPNFNEIYKSRGIAFFDKGLYDNAISDFEKVIQTQPYSFQVYYNKAQSCEKTGQLSEALEAYTSFLKKVPAQYIYHIEYTKNRINELEKNIN